MSKRTHESASADSVNVHVFAGFFPVRWLAVILLVANWQILVGSAEVRAQRSKRRPWFFNGLHESQDGIPNRDIQMSGFASRARFTLALDEGEKCHDGIFQRTVRPLLAEFATKKPASAI